MAERIFTNAYMVLGVGAKIMFYIVANFSASIKAKWILRSPPPTWHSATFRRFPPKSARNFAGYRGIWRNVAEYGGIWRNIKISIFIDFSFFSIKKKCFKSGGFSNFLAKATQMICFKLHLLTANYVF